MEYLRTMFSSSLLHIPEDIRNLFYLSTADHVAAVLMVGFGAQRWIGSMRRWAAG